MLDLLVFSAANCGPCRAMEAAGIYSELRAEGHKVTKIDVYQDRNTANLYRISAMPTFVFLKDGSEVKRVIGACSKAQLLVELTQEDV